MKKHKLKILALLGMCAWFAMGINLGLAQEVIFQVNSSGKPLPNEPVTISILDQKGEDITGYWLPILEEPVIVRVNNISSEAQIKLVDPSPSYPDPIKNQSLTTSAYPGICTNFGKDTGSDFEFDENTKVLTPKDFGGMAVVEISGTDMRGVNFEYFYIIPADSDFDGIPDNYEKIYCTQFTDSSRLTCINPGDDYDASPEENLSPKGDGIAARDEYRGFMVSGKHIRTDPRVKDLFVNLVTEQAGTNQVNLKIFFGDDLTLFFANMDNFSTGLNVHHITKDEWIDYFESYSPSSGLQLLRYSDPAKDRCITQNALVLPESGKNAAKGIRLIESLDFSLKSPLGLTIKKAPPDGLEKEYGNSVIFTRRICESYDSKFNLGGDRKLRYYTFENGAWNIKWSGTGVPTDDDRKFILKEALAFYAAHETTGHPLDLTPTLEGTKKEAYGYHHADGTGTNIDITIVHKVDRKETDYNNFYIPKSFGISDKRDMRILSSQ